MGKKTATEKVIAALEADIAVKEQELEALRQAVRELEMARMSEKVSRLPAVRAVASS